jgi:hypothetical protein
MQYSISIVYTPCRSFPWALTHSPCPRSVFAAMYNISIHDMCAFTSIFVLPSLSPGRACVSSARCRIFHLYPNSFPIFVRIRPRQPEKPSTVAQIRAQSRSCGYPIPSYTTFLSPLLPCIFLSLTVVQRCLSACAAAAVDGKHERSPDFAFSL